MLTSLTVFVRTSLWTLLVTLTDLGSEKEVLTSLTVFVRTSLWTLLVTLTDLGSEKELLTSLSLFFVHARTLLVTWVDSVDLS